jgi:hypothetical protein
LLYLPPKLVCIHQNFLHRVYTNLNSSFLDPSFLEWRLGCKTCIVYTGLNFSWIFTKFYYCDGQLVKLKETVSIKLRKMSLIDKSGFQCLHPNTHMYTNIIYIPILKCCLLRSAINQMFN